MPLDQGKLERNFSIPVSDQRELLQDPKSLIPRLEGKVGTLQGDLCIPKGARAIVLFAHGSGSGMYTARNQFVAQVLNDSGLATLRVDLLTTEEKEIE